ncbi:hypothetical protein SLEP1_g53834 [Rubroshorea leprosula]|uniref:Uncharacterized protein n=1 Tax=Rubroshorea leprosula TaxID=152421 RepID=A0AAV5MBJ9_9ROSI|nr:hypothetical protein SLEP1_g53834 [Rubroshorea leprosula]
MDLCTVVECGEQEHNKVGCPYKDKEEANPSQTKVKKTGKKSSNATQKSKATKKEYQGW